MNDLNAAWQAASEEMYKASQGAGQQTGGPTGNPAGEQSTGNTQQGGKGSDEQVTDVDFEEVK